jgi:hypothetical protein
MAQETLVASINEFMYSYNTTRKYFKIGQLGPINYAENSELPIRQRNSRVYFHWGTSEA